MMVFRGDLDRYLVEIPAGLRGHYYAVRGILPVFGDFMVVDIFLN